MITRRPERSAFLLLLATTTVACGGTQASAPSPSSATTRTQQAEAERARELLSAQSAGQRQLGVGDGSMEPVIGNTLAEPPSGTRAVTLAFVCTGGASVRLEVLVANRTAASTSVTCDGTVSRTEAALPEPAGIGFSATVSGGSGGGFAYAYEPAVTSP